MSRLETAQAAYIRAFGELPPQPWGISDDVLADVIERAIVDGAPVPPDFDWWADMPPDAVA